MVVTDRQRRSQLIFRCILKSVHMGIKICQRAWDKCYVVGKNTYYAFPIISFVDKYSFFQYKSQLLRFGIRCERPITWRSS